MWHDKKQNVARRGSRNFPPPRIYLSVVISLVSRGGTPPPLNDFSPCLSTRKSSPPSPLPSFLKLYIQEQRWRDSWPAAQIDFKAYIKQQTFSFYSLPCALVLPPLRARFTTQSTSRSIDQVPPSGHPLVTLAHVWDRSRARLRSISIHMCPLRYWFWVKVFHKSGCD